MSDPLELADAVLYGSADLYTDEQEILARALREQVEENKRLRGENEVYKEAIKTAIAAHYNSNAAWAEVTLRRALSPSVAREEG